jgi:hypothetical protein
MTYTKKQFIEDVKKEARALREHATKDELDKLDFQTLKYDEPTACIYGQMAFQCRSERASELIGLCCKRFFNNDVLGRIEFAKSRVSIDKAITEEVNGETCDDIGSMAHVSCIETYICLPDAQRKNLIDYLKGNRNDLVL